MLLVQKFLENKTFGDLVAEHGVYASFGRGGYKWSISYDQIEAKEADPLAQECRGLILASEDGRSLINDGDDHTVICPGKTQILAFPMRRFFNFGQGSAAKINWNDPKLSIQNKEDGTLIILYFDPIANTWHTATRGVCEANVPLDNGKYTFRSLFEVGLFNTTGLSIDNFVAKLDKGITYCFELTSPYNRVVVNYPKTTITWLAARDIRTLQELDITTFDIGVPRTKTYTFATLSDIIEYVGGQNPFDHEGVVVCDSNFNRIKVKNPAHGLYGKLREKLGTSQRNCLELILLEKDDDAIPMLPEEIVSDLVTIKRQFVDMVNGYNSFYSAIKSSLKENTKKEFALTLKRYNVWSAPLFNIYDGKAKDMKDFVMSNKVDGTWSNSFLDRLLEVMKDYG